MKKTSNNNASQYFFLSMTDREEKEKLATCRDGDDDVYREGQKFISKLNPCYECICNKDSDNYEVTNSPYCQKLSCDIELKYKSYVQRGCLPIFENDKCCPVDWQCREWQY
jgi:hypothetical protein